MALYELALMGEPPEPKIQELTRHLTESVEPFGLRLGTEVGWSTRATHVDPPQNTPAAVAYFAGDGTSTAGLNNVLRRGIPIVPVAATPARVGEIPAELRGLNYLIYSDDGPQRISTALLECVGLLPRQRRVFLSYRRSEARAAALQLFDEISARGYDVFLDTHDVAPAEDFQAVIWHRLCDSDVLVMLDTPGYFDSRWTAAEFGRALAKGISVLRVGWPDCAPSRRIATASQIDITEGEVDVATGRLSDHATSRVCLQIETVRSLSHAVRTLNLFSNLQQAVERIGGGITGVGPGRAVHIRLLTGRDVVVFPTVGVPTSQTLQDAFDQAPDHSVAVLYDHIGLHERWLKHLTWLGENIHAVRWVRASDTAWALAGWEV